MSVSTIMVRVLVDAVERAGVSRDELLCAQETSLNRLTDPHGRFDLDEFALLQIRAMDLTGDEALGFRIAEYLRHGAFDVIGHLIAHAPTLREGLRLCAQFQPIIRDDAEFVVREEGHSAMILFRFARSVDRADRMHREFAMASILLYIRIFGGDGFVPERAFFQHARPAHSREYARLFGRRTRFGQDRTGLVFARELLDREQLHQNAELYELLQSHATRDLERVTSGRGFADSVKGYLLSRASERVPTMETVAMELGVTARTLRRRLKGDATTFRSLRQGTLEASAGQLLLDRTRTVQDTARALGYSDIQGFTRAFKRWTGKTPTQFQGRRKMSGRA
jgi:AraC-like DNA-binding protein